MERKEAPQCTACGEDLTVRHILEYCRLYIDQKAAMGIPEDIGEALRDDASAIDRMADLSKMESEERKAGKLEKVLSLGTGRRGPHDPLFAQGDKICGLYAKAGIIDVDDESFCHKPMKKFECKEMGCNKEFEELLSYEIHYNSCHRYVCSQCKRHLPSPHLLDLHISESHDSFFKALSERKPMYRCFVEECTTVSKDPKERRSHCIDVHKYPHDFKFDASRKSQKKKSAKEPKAKKSEKEAKSKRLEKEEGAEKDEAAGKAAGPYKGPFFFGHRKAGKTFKTPKQKDEKPIEMHELMETLPS